MFELSPTSGVCIEINQCVLEEMREWEYCQSKMTKASYVWKCLWQVQLRSDNLWKKNKLHPKLYDRSKCRSTNNCKRYKSCTMPLRTSLSSPTPKKSKPQYHAGGEAQWTQTREEKAIIPRVDPAKKASGPEHTNTTSLFHIIIHNTHQTRKNKSKNGN